ncbi:hypothetical protein HRbin19_01573 [bacterium HR19]|nr:hypothetical protein HRbin19_01573 [bacterium HR19]
MREEEFKRVIAKGKKKEFFQDKIYELGERLFDILAERWKEAIAVVLALSLAIFLVWAVREREKNKEKEDFLKFEIANQYINTYDLSRDKSALENAINTLSQIDKKPKHISKILLAWAFSKNGEIDKATQTLNSVIEDQSANEKLKDLARIMKINILGDKNCNEVIKTWEQIKSKNKEKITLGKEGDKSGFPIPLRTYFEVSKCAKDRKDILNEIISELNFAYSIEQFISPEKAKYILVIKKFAQDKMNEK